MPNAVPKKPWTHILVDFITKLLLVQEYNSILVVCDRMMKIAYFVPTMEKTLVKGVARLFWDNIWKLHRLPESIIMNREAQFVAGIIKELNRMLGINTKLSTAYHPCHDLAKWLSYYLYFFSFLFFSYLQLQDGAWESIT